MVRIIWKPDGMTLGELARRTGLERPHLSRIFNGHQLPSLRAAQLIATVLHMTVDQLLLKLDYPRPRPRIRKHPATD